MVKIAWTLLRFGLYEPFFALPIIRYFRFLRPLLWLFNGHREKRLAVRIRLALEQLGPTFIKLGQALSTRYDLLDREIVEELTKLQDQVPPFPSSEAINIIEEALKQPLKSIFSTFEQEPIAAASIAQVHGAVLKSGESVVVKVVRPNIQKVIKRDIRLLETLAYLVERYYKAGKRLRPQEIVAEYSRTIMNELDLTIEAANGMQLRQNFIDSHILYVPKIYLDYTRKNIMVMERVSGVPIGEVEHLKELGVDIPLLAQRSVEIFFTQVFKHSFFHADMHPGNILVDVTNPKDPTYIALDYGIVGTLNENDKHYLASNFLAFFNRDYLRVAELHVESGWVPADTSIGDFEVVIRSLCEPIFDKPLKDISFGGFLLSLFQTAQRFKMEMQPQLMLLQKTLFSIEGLGRELYPELDLWSTAKPFLVAFVEEKQGPRATVKRYMRDFPHWVDQFPELLHNVQLAVRQQAKGEGRVSLTEEVWQEYRAITQEQNEKRFQGVIGLIFLVFLLLSIEEGFTFKNILYTLLTLFFLYLPFRRS